jgi:hypothetical protein
MRPTLTEEMRRALDAQPGKPISVFDPATNISYVLIRADLYEDVRPLLEDMAVVVKGTFEIPEGVHASQRAFRRDLPRLLADSRSRGKWAAYHGGERVGIGDTQTELHRECLRLGLSEDSFYIGRIVPSELEEEEDIDPSYFEFEDENKRS